MKVVKMLSVVGILVVVLIFSVFSAFAVDGERRFSDDEQSVLKDGISVEASKLGDEVEAQEVSSSPAIDMSALDEARQSGANGPNDPVGAIMLAIASVLGIGGAGMAVGKVSDEVKNKMPQGSGLWIPDKDRESIPNLINEASKKQYSVDRNGFVVENKDKLENERGSQTATELVDRLVGSDKLSVMGTSEKVLKQDENGNAYEDGVIGGLTVGKSGTDQVVLLNPEFAQSGNKESIALLGHEMAHAVDGVEGTKNTEPFKNEEYAINAEKQVRDDLGMPDAEVTDYAAESNLYSPWGFTGGGFAGMASRFAGWRVVGSRGKTYFDNRDNMTVGRYVET